MDEKGRDILAADEEGRRSIHDPNKAAVAHYDPETLEIDHEAEAKLVRKVDCYVVPVVLLVYLFSFLDRVNIGNARLYGLEEDLGLTGDQFQTAVSLLFVTYILTEVPSNLVLKKFTPSRWISFLTVCWGIVATLTGVCQNYGGLIVCRLLLGLFEGGLFPGFNIYLTLFYTRNELGLRVAYLFVAAALAGAFGGLLAYGIGFMDGIAGQAGWRWIMILEGIPTVLLGIAVWWVLADDPENAFYLTPEEKLLMTVRRERQVGHTKSSQKFHREDVYKGFKDWKIWMFCAGQFGVDTMLYGYSTFLPTIIAGLGEWSTAETQALTVPCYGLGAIVYLICAYLSDRTQFRAIFPVLFGSISVVGYGVLISDSSAGVHYFGCFLVALGLYTCVGIPLCWLPLNQPRYGKRTTATGMQLTIGNTSGIMAPFLYKTHEAPRFIRGHSVTLGLVAAQVLNYSFMWWYFSRENKKKREGMHDYKMQGKTEDEIAEMGDENPRFMYHR